MSEVIVNAMYYYTEKTLMKRGSWSGKDKDGNPMWVTTFFWLYGEPVWIFVINDVGYTRWSDVSHLLRTKQTKYNPSAYLATKLRKSSMSKMTRRADSINPNADIDVNDSGFQGTIPEYIEERCELIRDEYTTFNPVTLTEDNGFYKDETWQVTDSANRYVRFQTVSNVTSGGAKRIKRKTTKRKATKRKAPKRKATKRKATKRRQITKRTKRMRRKLSNAQRGGVTLSDVGKVYTVANESELPAWVDTEDGELIRHGVNYTLENSFGQFGLVAEDGETFHVKLIDPDWKKMKLVVKEEAQKVKVERKRKPLTELVSELNIMQSNLDTTYSDGLFEMDQAGFVKEYKTLISLNDAAGTGRLFNQFLRAALSNEIPTLLDSEDIELFWRFCNKLITDINRPFFTASITPYESAMAAAADRTEFNRLKRELIAILINELQYYRASENLLDGLLPQTFELIKPTIIRAMIETTLEGLVRFKNK